MSATGAKLDVLVLGLDPIYLDLIFSGLEGVPQPGEEIFAKSFQLLPGGVFNIAGCLGKLGVDVALAADVDQGLFGDFMLRELQRVGVRIDAIRRLELGGTALTVSYSLGNERAFLSYKDPSPQRRDVRLLCEQHKPRIMIIPGFPFQAFEPEVLDPLCSVAMQDDYSVLIDSCHCEASLEQPEVARLVSLADVFFCNQAECLRITGEDEWQAGADRLLSFTDAVVIKLGEQGAAFVSHDESFIESAPQVEVKDTTGAGDCFVATYAFGLLQGMSDRDCLRMAVLQGTASVRGAGGTTTLMGREELIEALKRSD
ncbi:MAG: carbohydrate kinase family protein [Candidatus Alcyoniella australis]|nr:carbohydrate kinase family protein [Candidatus Alcyoniella australis]